MRTESQANASRVNGAKSHGPVTPEGKARAALNACTHRMTAKTRVLPGEDPNDWLSLLDDYIFTYNPQNPVEVDQVAALADLRFRIRRCGGAETATLSRQVGKAPDQFDNAENWRSWNLYNQTKGAAADVGDSVLAASAELETFASGVRRKLAYWIGVSRRERWGFEERCQALLLLNKHPRWIHTDAEVQMIHLCIEKTYDCADHGNLKEWCSKYSRGWECEKKEDTLKLCKKRIPRSFEAAKAHLDAVVRAEIARLEALLPGLDALHAAERELVARSAAADDTSEGAVRMRYAAGLERDYDRTHKTSNASNLHAR